MFGKKIPLFKLFGFQVSIDFSWFLIAILVTWSLAASLFPRYHEDLSTTTHWIMGVAGALGLFASVIAHEFGHAMTARRFGVEMRGITLFIFGGVAEMSQEPPSAKAEFWIAVAGPIVSLALGLVLVGLDAARTTLALPEPVAGVVGYLGWINLVLVGFNIIPAFPLDGGRVLRAILWHVRGDLSWATKVTAELGSSFGIALFVLGLLFFITGNLIAGVWWFLLGLFLRGAARMSYQQVLLRRALEGERVEAFMRPDPVTVGPDLPISDLVEEVIYHHHHKLYPVVDQGRLLGCVTLQDVKLIPRDQWPEHSVSEIMTEPNENNTVGPDADAMRVLSTLHNNGISRLMVARDDRLEGVIALKDLMGFLSLKIDLEGG